MESKVTVSVIIPLYNRKQFLKRCVGSVLAQSFSDWELIIVDDGSTDAPEEILAELQQKDARIRVLRQKNGGVSAARNAGSAAARGEYIQFLDSDDELRPEILALAVTEGEATGADVVVYQIGPAGSPQDDLLPPRASVRLRGGASCALAMLEQNTLNSPVNKLWRRDSMRGITFPTTISWGEDLIFNLQFLSRSHMVSLMPLVGYYVYVGSPLSLSQRYHPQGFADFLAQKEAIEEFMRQHPHAQLQERFTRYLWACYMQCVRKLCLGSGLSYRGIIAQLREWDAHAVIAQLRSYAEPHPTLVSRLMRAGCLWPVPCTQRLVAVKSVIAAMVRRSLRG